ncbi:transposase [Escherichia coli]|uniref:Transposase n=1 Tax=Escherichia coli TaxID=562 RepID=A0A376MQA9_ECOLX|nr:transposase [Escherichia coli]
MKLSATVLTRLCVNHNEPSLEAERDALREEVARLNQEIRRRQMELDILKKAEEIIKNLWSPRFCYTDF